MIDHWLWHTERIPPAITALLTDLLGNPLLVDLVKMALAGAVLAGFTAVSALALVWIERKVAAHVQQRLGPMRVGPHGLLQTLADGLKLLSKENITPLEADRFVFHLAPLLCFAATFVALAFIPWAPSLQVVNFNVGLVFVLGIGSVGVLGILAAGWSSNNKWSLLGAMRAGAQIISYELSATIALISILVFAGSLDFREIVESQRGGWWIWRAPLVGFVAFVIYGIASTAECNRTPFDLVEGESELTAGFHTEYASIRFAMFFLAEFVNIFLVCSISATVFLGGWMPFHIGNLTGFNRLADLIPPWGWFLFKTMALIFVFMWVRWTFPRLRVDQLMNFEWKFLLPLAFCTLAVASVLVTAGWYFFPG
jgi:NADH-quinone oxidoreductase subunit H